MRREENEAVRGVQPAAAVDISSHRWGLSKNILRPISRTILLPSYSGTVAQDKRKVSLSTGKDVFQSQGHAAACRLIAFITSGITSFGEETA